MGIIVSENKLSCGSTRFFCCSTEQENAFFVVVQLLLLLLLLLLLKLLPPIPFKYHAVLPVIILIFHVTDVFSFKSGINVLNSKEIAANNSVPEENEMSITSRAWHLKKKIRVATGIKPKKLCIIILFWETAYLPLP